MAFDLMFRYQCPHCGEMMKKIGDIYPGSSYATYWHSKSGEVNVWRIPCAFRNKPMVVKFKIDAKTQQPIILEQG